MGLVKMTLARDRDESTMDEMSPGMESEVVRPSWSVGADPLQMGMRRRYGCCKEVWAAHSEKPIEREHMHGSEPEKHSARTVRDRMEMGLILGRYGSGSRFVEVVW